MIVLGIETAGPHGSVALLEADRPLRQTVITATRQLGAELAPAIQRLLREAGLGPDHPPDLVAVDVGPGSYTGLRIGLAAAKGLAFAWGRPLIGIPTVDALEALAPPTAQLLCALDASRGQVYAALRRKPAAVEELDGLRARLTGPLLVVGDAAPLLVDPARGITAADPALAWPTAEGIARLALARHLGGERQDALRLSPIYFHANEAEAARRKRSMKV
jgi:tRNA threonylcarbamoyladenosine biosynthesis protein TsaB